MKHTERLVSYLSPDPNRAMQDMMDIINSLRGVYAEETEALNKADTKAFLDLQEKKMTAARQYQRGIEDILSREEQMKSVAPSLKNRLASMQKEFFGLSQKNLEALSRMQRCTSRLGETIMGAAKDAAKSQQTHVYGETGSIRDNERRSVSMGVSETA